MDFSQVEAQFKRLKVQFEAGALTEAEFKAQLEDLMIQDEKGRWWMIGYETGQWYLHDGSGWVRADPPGRVAPRTAPQPVARPVAPAKAKPQWLRGIAVLLLGLALTFGAGMGAGELAFWVFEDSETAWLCVGAVWFGGLILTINITRKVWRGE